MDSQLRPNLLTFMVDQSWREDINNLPNPDIYAPMDELPDPEPDNGNPNETRREVELKWTDLAISTLYPQNNSSLNPR